MLLFNLNLNYLKVIFDRLTIFINFQFMPLHFSSKMSHF